MIMAAWDPVRVLPLCPVPGSKTAMSRLTTAGTSNILKEV
jgi:hypothetical protein